MVYINAISYHLPENSLGNQEIIDEYLPYTKEGGVVFTADDLSMQSWVNRRFQSDRTETAKDLGNAAVKKLFAEWDIDKDSVEYLIFVSDALEYKGPTTACVMQNDLGLKQAIGAIDVLHGCTGYLYGLSLAKALISSGQVNNVLLVTADVPTKVIHPEDVGIRAIFSDAGAASFISKEKIINSMNASIGQFEFGTDGSGEHALKVERSGTRMPADIDWLTQFKEVPHGNTGGRLVMKDSAIFLFAVRTVPRLVKALLEKEDLTDEDISLYVLHQANGQMLDFIRKRMKIPQDKFVINIQEIGNTVSASVPIALYETFKTGKIKDQDRVLLAGFGIGLSWGGTIIKFHI